MGWREWLEARPLAVLALAAGAGIAAAHAAPPLSVWSWLGLPVFAWISWKASQTGRLSFLVVVAAVAFGAWHRAALKGTRDHPARQLLLASGSTMDVEVHGVVERALRSDLPGATSRDAFFIADEVTCAPLGKSFAGRMALRLFTGSREILPPGEYVVRGRMKLPAPPDNPGEFDRRDYDLRLGLAAELRATRTTLIRKDAVPINSLLLDAAERCRAWVARALSVDLDSRPEERAIILAMALGAIEPEARELQKPFRESGTLHIFAVSGLHVAILATIFWALFRVFCRRRGLLVLLLITALFGYAFITGLKPSAVRAAVMTSVVLIGTAFNRNGDMLNSLGAAALLLLAFDTHQLFAPGFQLSFGVLASIGLFGGWLTRKTRRFTDPDPFLPRQMLSTPQKGAWWLRREAAALFTVSLAAWIGSLPLVFHHFHLVTPVSLLANMLLVPLSFLVLGTAVATLLAGALPFLFQFQLWFSNANLAFAWMTIFSARQFAAVPMGNFYLPQATLERRPPAEMQVLRLQGGAAAQHLRVGSSRWLFDCGGTSDYGFVLRPCLHFLGLNRLDGLVLSHSDFAHMGAAGNILQDFQPRDTYLPAREPWRWDTGRSSMRLLHAGGWHGKALTRGDVLDLGQQEGQPARARVLFPTPDSWPRKSDDRTLVLRFDIGPHRLLWCNDAGFLAEKTLLEKAVPGELRCDVIIRNQHASDFSLLPEFLDAVQPRLIITSSDTFPAEQKLPAHTLEACAARGIIILDQEITGATALRLWPDRMEVRPFHDRAPFELRTGGVKP